MVWLKLTFFLLIVFAINFALKFSLIKLFGIKPGKKELFSYNHINDLHRRVDWFVRYGTLIAGIVLLYLSVIEEYSPFYYLAGILFFTVVDHSVTAFFEWQASPQPKQAILTLGQMAVWVVALVVLIQTNFFLLGAIGGVVTEKTDTSFKVEATSFNFGLGPAVHEIHMTDYTVFKGAALTFEEMEEGDLVRVVPFDLPAEFSYTLASEVTVE